jgi:hypothetical protein
VFYLNIKNVDVLKMLHHLTFSRMWWLESYPKHRCCLRCDRKSVIYCLWWQEIVSILLIMIFDTIDYACHTSVETKVKFLQIGTTASCNWSGHVKRMDRTSILWIALELKCEVERLMRQSRRIFFTQLLEEIRKEQEGKVSCYPWEPERKRRLMRLKHSEEDNIKM